MGKLDKKVAVITGAAGGIGRAAAKLFAQEGARLMLVDLNEASLAHDAEDDNASGHGDFRLRFVSGVLLIEFDCLLGAMALLAISGKGVTRLFAEIF